jgi:hypothetical protein
VFLRDEDCCHVLDWIRKTQGKWGSCSALLPYFLLFPQGNFPAIE